MIVAYAATRNLYQKMRPSILSLLDHNQIEHLYILAEDDELPYEIGCPCSVLNVSGQTVFTGPNTQTYFTYMSMMRLTLSYLTRAERIIYLDCDTIVCDSLQPLWDMDMDGKWWAAVEEYLGQWKPWGEAYYNAGVCVFNLKQMREDKIVPHFINDLNTMRFRFIEQDVLNLYCVPDHIVPLDVRYNECFATGYTDNPAIIHYAGYGDWYENKKLFRHEYLEKYTPPC